MKKGIYLKKIYLKKGIYLKKIYLKNHLITILLNDYMILKIDARENELVEHIKGIIQNRFSYQCMEVLVESLPIGDIIISDSENNDLVMIERKTVNDLLASIKDGRYEEQSYRLNGSEIHNHNIIYLIEGDINKINRFKDNNTSNKTIFYSSLFSLNYYKGFSVQRTFSIEETALFICNTVYKLKKGLEEKKVPYYISNMNNVDKEEPYVNVVKKVKKENITPENIGEIMLCSIPGISSITANAIMKEYSSIYNLIEQITKNEKCLENISYINTKGQQRKINKLCIKNISNYLITNKEKDN